MGAKVAHTLASVVAVALVAEIVIHGDEVAGVLGSLSRVWEGAMAAMWGARSTPAPAPSVAADRSGGGTFK